MASKTANLPLLPFGWGTLARQHACQDSLFCKNSSNHFQNAEFARSTTQKTPISGKSSQTQRIMTTPTISKLVRGFAPFPSQNAIASFPPPCTRAAYAIDAPKCMGDCVSVSKALTLHSSSLLQSSQLSDPYFQGQAPRLPGFHSTVERTFSHHCAP